MHLTSVICFQYPIAVDYTSRKFAARMMKLQSNIDCKEILRTQYNENPAYSSKSRYQNEFNR
mgnify:CR=1 FL=1